MKSAGIGIEVYREGSGWVGNEIVAVEVNLLKYRPLAGSRYIPTPKKLLRNEALVNVQNLYDDKCFFWSVLALSLIHI